MNRILLDFLVATAVVCVSLLVWKIRTALLKVKPVYDIDEYRKWACTGDLAFFGDFKPQLRMALNAHWNHVGMIVVPPDRSEVYLWESNVLEESDRNMDLTDQVTGEKKNGPQLVRLSEKLAGYMGRWMMQSLVRENQETSLEDENALRYNKLYPLVTKYSGYDFDWRATLHAWNTLYHRELVPFGPLRFLYRESTDRNTMFCSELVAEGLKKFGALHERAVPLRVYPNDFLMRRGCRVLAPGWYLSTPFTVSLIA